MPHTDMRPAPMGLQALANPFSAPISARKSASDMEGGAVDEEESFCEVEFPPLCSEGDRSDVRIATTTAAVSVSPTTRPQPGRGDVVIPIVQRNPGLQRPPQKATRRGDLGKRSQAALRGTMHETSSLAGEDNSSLSTCTSSEDDSSGRRVFPRSGNNRRIPRIVEDDFMCCAPEGYCPQVIRPWSVDARTYAITNRFTMMFRHPIVEDEFLVYYQLHRKVPIALCFILSLLSIIGIVMYINVELNVTTRVLFAFVAAVWFLCGIFLVHLQRMLTAIRVEISRREKRGVSLFRGGKVDSSLVDYDCLMSLERVVSSRVTKIVSAVSSFWSSSSAPAPSSRVNNSNSDGRRELFNASYSAPMGRRPTAPHGGGVDSKDLSIHPAPLSELEQLIEGDFLFSEKSMFRDASRRNARLHEMTVLVVIVACFVFSIANYAGKGDCRSPEWTTWEVEYRACRGAMQSDGIVIILIVVPTILTSLRFFLFATVYLVMTGVYFGVKFTPVMMDVVVEYFWASFAIVVAEVGLCVAATYLKEQHQRAHFETYVQRHLKAVELSEVHRKTERMIAAQIPLAAIRAIQDGQHDPSSQNRPVGGIWSWSFHSVVCVLAFDGFATFASRRGSSDIVELLQRLFDVFDNTREEICREFVARQQKGVSDGKAAKIEVILDKFHAFGDRYVVMTLCDQGNASINLDDILDSEDGDEDSTMRTVPVADFQSEGSTPKSKSFPETAPRSFEDQPTAHSGAGGRTPQLPRTPLGVGKSTTGSEASTFVSRLRRKRKVVARATVVFALLCMQRAKALLALEEIRSRFHVPNILNQLPTMELMPIASVDVGPAGGLVNLHTKNLNAVGPAVDRALRCCAREEQFVTCSRLEDVVEFQGHLFLSQAAAKICGGDLKPCARKSSESCGSRYPESTTSIVLNMCNVTVNTATFRGIMLKDEGKAIVGTEPAKRQQRNVIAKKQNTGGEQEAMKVKCTVVHPAGGSSSDAGGQPQGNPLFLPSVAATSGGRSIYASVRPQLATSTTEVFAVSSSTDAAAPAPTNPFLPYAHDPLRQPDLSELTVTEATTQPFPSDVALPPVSTDGRHTTTVPDNENFITSSAPTTTREDIRSKGNDSIVFAKASFEPDEDEAVDPFKPKPLASIVSSDATNPLDIVLRYLVWMTFRSEEFEAQYQELIATSFTLNEVLWSVWCNAVAFVILLVLCAIYSLWGRSSSDPLLWVIVGIVLCVATAGLALAADDHASPWLIYVILHYGMSACFLTAVFLAPSHNVIGDSQMVWYFVLLQVSLARPRWSHYGMMWLRDLIVSIAVLLRTLYWFNVDGAVKSLSLYLEGGGIVYSLLLWMFIEHSRREDFANEKHIEHLKKKINEDYDKLEAAMRQMAPEGVAGHLVAKGRSRKAHQEDGFRLHPLWSTSFGTATSETPFAFVEVRSPAAAVGASRRTSRSCLCPLTIGAPPVISSRQSYSQSSSSLHSISERNSMQYQSVAVSPYATPSYALDWKTCVRQRMQLLKRVFDLNDTDTFTKKVQCLKAEGDTLMVVALPVWQASKASSTTAEIGGATPTTATTAKSYSHEERSVILLHFAVALLRELEILGRVVVAAGPIMGAVVGRGSVSFEYYGPAAVVAVEALRYVEWGTAVVTRRALDAAVSGNKSSALSLVTDAEASMCWRLPHSKKVRVIQLKQ